MSHTDVLSLELTRPELIDSGYQLTTNLTLSAGVKNLFNRFPDKAISRGFSQPYVYPSFSPFGFNGAFYYAMASYQF